MITKNNIIDMYTHLRETNQSIPTEALDWVKGVCMERLESEEVVSDLVHTSTEGSAVAFNYSGEKQIADAYGLKPNAEYRITIREIKS